MGLMRSCALAAIGLSIIGMTSVSAAKADGALAIGKCDRWGYSYGYSNREEAEDRALSECSSDGDTSCQVVVRFSGNCAAFAVSGECGARGWSYAPSREQAERLALRECERYGGDECEIKAWVCDGG
jgi:hypothetical protein